MINLLSLPLKHVRFCKLLLNFLVPSARIFPCASISASVLRMLVTLCVLISSGLLLTLKA
ncbi:hypothetical protein Hanom_Chr12g01066991 [Helianthus anomalus]